MSRDAHHGEDTTSPTPHSDTSTCGAESIRPTLTLSKPTPCPYAISLTGTSTSEVSRRLIHRRKVLIHNDQFNTRPDDP